MQFCAVPGVLCTFVCVSAGSCSSARFCHICHIYSVAGGAGVQHSWRLDGRPQYFGITTGKNLCRFVKHLVLANLASCVIGFGLAGKCGNTVNIPEIAIDITKLLTIHILTGFL